MQSRTNRKRACIPGARYTSVSEGLVPRLRTHVRGRLSSEMSLNAVTYIHVHLIKRSSYGQQLVSSTKQLLARSKHTDMTRAHCCEAKMRRRLHSTNDYKRFKFTAWANCFFDNALRCELQPGYMTILMVQSEINCQRYPGELRILAIVLLEQAQATS